MWHMLSMVVIPQFTKCSDMAVGAKCAVQPILLCPDGSFYQPLPPLPDLGRGPPASSLHLLWVPPYPWSPAFLTTSHHVACSFLLTPTLGPCSRRRSICRASIYLSLIGSQVYLAALFTVLGAQCTRELHKVHEPEEGECLMSELKLTVGPGGKIQLRFVLCQGHRI